MDESILLEGIRSGDRVAFNTVFNMLNNKVLFAIMRYEKSLIVAEDVLAEAWIAMFTHREMFNSLTHIRQFLIKAARFKAINDYRKAVNRHLKNVELLDQVFVAEEVKVCDYEPILEYIREIVNSLPPKQKKVFIMRFYEGLSTEVISEKLGIAYQTCRNQYTDVMTKLKKKCLPMIPVWEDILPGI